MIVILGTGGTIAGTAASATDAVGYSAAQIGVAQLVAAVPPLAALPLECEQVAQLDSKDMDFATWQRLAQRTAFHLARAEVAGVVVTHGTGNGTLHRDLEASLLRAQTQGVRVLRTSRCAAGAVIGDAPLPSAGRLSAAQARIELLLELLGTA